MDSLKSKYQGFTIEDADGLRMDDGEDPYDSEVSFGDTF
jgi:hypothetical protein